jgi:hypothetical protein
MRAPYMNQGYLVERKETTSLAGRVTRWWSAPVRLPSTTWTLLRRAAARRGLGFPEMHPWVRQAPNGIRA